MSIDKIASSNTTTNYNIESIRKAQNDNNGDLPKEFVNSGNGEPEIPVLPNRSKEQVEEIVDKMNSFLEPTQTSIQFKFHEKLNEYYVTIVDQKTDEVVREIPSKKLLDIYAAMTEFLGLVVDKKI